jgi:hypothetical protein
MKPGSVDWRRCLGDPAHFAREVLGQRLHPGQAAWLTNSRCRENLLATGNRWGKSFVSAVKLVHAALFRVRSTRFDGSGRYRAVVASITQEQANLVFDQAVRLVHQSPLLAPLVGSLVRTPFPRLTLGNGATIESRSTQNRGQYLLGNDYDLFVFDEVAFESDAEYVVEEVIQMRLADREGRLDLVSTPNGKNWFYRRACELQSGVRRGYYQTGDSRENVAISRRFLHERVRCFSERRVRQNIMGQFVDSGGEVIPGAHVDLALALEARLRRRGTAESVGEGRYVTGWDLARKRTATVGVTVALVDGVARVVALERFQHLDWQVVIERIKARQRGYPGQLVLDATGLGDVIAQQLAEYNPLCFVFTPVSKSELLTNLEVIHAQRRIAYGRWEIADSQGRVWSLEDELRQARWDDNSECDALMALALAVWPLHRGGRAAVQPRVGRI